MDIKTYLEDCGKIMGIRHFSQPQVHASPRLSRRNILSDMPEPISQPCGPKLNLAPIYLSSN